MVDGDFSQQLQATGREQMANLIRFHQGAQFTVETTGWKKIFYKHWFIFRNLKKKREEKICKVKKMQIGKGVEGMV